MLEAVSEAVGLQPPHAAQRLPRGSASSGREVAGRGGVERLRAFGAADRAAFEGTQPNSLELDDIRWNIWNHDEIAGEMRQVRCRMLALGAFLGAEAQGGTVDWTRDSTLEWISWLVDDVIGPKRMDQALGALVASKAFVV